MHIFTGKADEDDTRKRESLSIVMIRLPAGLQFQKVPRVVAYALLATGVTAALFAADTAYRWYHDAGTQVASPLTSKSTEASKSAPVEATASASPAQAEAETSKQNAVDAKGPVEPKPATAQAASSSNGLVPTIANGPVSDPAVGAIPGGSTSNIAGGPASEAANAPANVAPLQVQPSLQPKPQQVRRLPAQQATRERAAPRRPVHAATKPPARTEKPHSEKPNVYWESDSQLGFAPQLRKRTCNPATGQMPMQCYYPREGREKFPAKSVN